MVTKPYCIARSDSRKTAVAAVTTAALVVALAAKLLMPHWAVAATLDGEAYAQPGRAALHVSSGGDARMLELAPANLRARPALDAFAGAGQAPLAGAAPSGKNSVREPGRKESGSANGALQLGAGNIEFD